MTKSQADVVRTALEILDEHGVDAVSLRAIAGRLGVRMNTVLWHAKSKARLEELMADAIVAGVSLDRLPEDWRERATEVARRYRRALLAHRDGAVVVTGTYAAEPATLDVTEALVAALLDGGLPSREAAWTCWGIIYFTLGLCQEEQAFPNRSVQDLDVGERPALQRVVAAMADDAFDERFEFGVARLLGAAATRRSHRPT
ncbi:putative TetR family transcriptional regulator [Nocardia brasiliensis NBRC 14402]|uniref:TetR/AcrR family transcriptional regulator C-terminal domain-containing protein n=1 Tax=Nocardia brasiliensis TaxID=37326 RepID=UPI0003092A60|nr:TetR/AcrR family transcriptional regulator C-terminal domain-containing protein [Nocardia brasiliensis]ASF07037.1 TetR family transcriptional regulator [Nocardia brasiliensis]GAJ84483.1 putative TetR family transcriptional regulator [Nocardia brasiliensis NBRC 14402]SUB47711.1 Tetracycline repressor protein class E [Nocardia brasiliensis]